MNAAAIIFEYPQQATPVSPDDLERVRAEQRRSNQRAIQAYARERLSLIAIAPAALMSAIEFWEGDAPAIRRGNLALTRLSILIEHAALSDIAARYARRWIDDARAALARFETPWGPAA